jgi:hypothetical protein
MKYISQKIKILFFIKIATIILGVWLLWMGVDVYLTVRDPLVQIESQRAITMVVVGIFLFILLLSGLVLSVMIEIKRYIRYFSIYIALLLIVLLMVKSLLG